MKHIAGDLRTYPVTPDAAVYPPHARHISSMFTLKHSGLDARISKREIVIDIVLDEDQIYRLALGK